MNTVALLLAAGQGSRLGQLTREKPKCLVPVNGVPILTRVIEGLSVKGISNLCIVCGYYEDVLRRFCDENYPYMNIHYVQNSSYAITNSMYSLYLGLEVFLDAQTDVLVLESDIFFDPELLSFSPSPGLTWLGDSTYRFSGGAYIVCDKEKRITSIRIIRDLNLIQEGMLKSTGIFYVHRVVVPEIYHCLRQGVAKGQANLYYDLILEENLLTVPMYAQDVRPKRWIEIDTPEDLKLAERMFG